MLLFIVAGCGSSSDGPVGATAAGAGGAPAGQGGSSAGAGGVTAGQGGAAGAAAASGKPAAGAAGISGSPTRPPPSTTAPTVTGVPTVVLAVDEVVLPRLATDQFVHADNLDGMKFSNPADPAHCKLRPGAKAKEVVIDGPNGEDDSFGKSVMPILLGLNPYFSLHAIGAITDGAGTLLVRARNLGPGDAYNGVSVDLLGALGDGTKPTSFDAYQWRPLASQLSAGAGQGDALVASGPSTEAYSVGDVLVARGLSGVVLPPMLFDDLADGSVALERAGVVLKLSADHRAITGGRVTGLVPTQSLSDAVRRWGGKVSSLLCDGTTIDTVITYVEAASDQLLTGAQDGSRTCDAISIGLGVRARASGVGGSSELVATTPCE